MKSQKITTPVGIASWCALNPDKPCTQFEPQWYVDLIVAKDDATDFMNKVQAFYDEAREEFGISKSTNPIPISEETDEDGKKTGNIIIKCKLPESGINEKTQKPWSNNPPVLYGADLAKWTPEGVIGKGTKMRASINMTSYDKPRVGMKMRLLGAQIIEPVYFGAEADASDFDTEQGTTNSGFGNEDNSGGEDSAPAGGYDFE